MHTSQISQWLIERLHLIRENKQDVKGVHLHNTTEVYFGKTNFRIYLEIEVPPYINDKLSALLEGERYEETEEEKYLCKLNRAADENDYITFRAIQVPDHIVSVHYEWISEIIRLWRKEGDPEITVDPFKHDFTVYKE